MIKPIVPIASPLVNYLTYIQACCGINWKLDDTPPAQDLLSDEDRNLMQSCVTDLSFGLGLGGSLAGMFYFLPAYIFRENDAGFTDYFTCLAQCHEAGSLSPLIEEYGHHIRQIEEFTGGALEEMPFGNKMLYKIKQLSAVYKAYYHKYLQYHWEEDRVIAEKTCDYIHEIFAGNDIVGRWEDLTGYELLSVQYQLLIVTSLQAGPAANSLHYGVNIFPALTKSRPKEYFTYFVSHEVGTHILKPHTLDQAQPTEEDFSVYYMGFENLARYINLKVLDYKYPYDIYDSLVFELIYKDLDTNKPEDISSLYFAAVEQFKRLKPEK